MIAGMEIGEVCSCGHPIRAHHNSGKCEISRLNCRCSKATPLLVTKNLQGYLHKHGRGAMGPRSDAWDFLQL